MLEFLTMVITMQITMFMFFGLLRLLKQAETDKNAVTEKPYQSYGRLI